MSNAIFECLAYFCVFVMYLFPKFMYHCTFQVLVVYFQFIFLFFFSIYTGSSCYSTTSNAFIFSLRNKEGLGPFKSMVAKSSNAICSSSSSGPRFGGGHDIYIYNNANSNTYSYTNFGNSYSVPGGVQDRQTILAGTYSFTPDEVEVFYLG